VSKLFVVASNVLLGNDYLGDKGNMPVRLGDVLLVAVKEEKWKQLEGSIVKVIKHYQPDIIRVAGHLRPCFGEAAEEVSKWQIRFLKHEKGLKELLACDSKSDNSVKLDIQVWGFHHDEYSKIWNVLTTVKDYTGDEASDRQKVEFANYLLSVFEDTVAQNVYERISIVKHRVVHLFLPIKFRLQLLDELRAEGQHDEETVEKILQEISISLNDKLNEASNLLNALDDIASLRSNSAKKTVADILGGSTVLEAAKFTDWLCSLDTELNNLRENPTK
jgi:hypothetical protein